MKRKWFLNILIFLSIILLFIGIGVLFKIEKWKDLQNSVIWNEPPIEAPTPDLDKLYRTENTNIIKGTIVRIEDGFLFVERGVSPKDSDLYNIQLADNPVIYVDGEISDISKVKLGQTVEVTYSGRIRIAERYPGIAMGVTKISTITEDVSLLDGTVMEIDDKTILIQCGENSDSTYKLSLSEETFMYMHGWHYGVGIMEVGQNVAVVYKDGIGGEVPSATIVLVK